MLPAPLTVPLLPLCFSVTTSHLPSGENSICAGSTLCAALLRGRADPAIAGAESVAPVGSRVQPAIADGVVSFPWNKTYTTLPRKVMLFGPGRDAPPTPAALTFTPVPSIPSACTGRTEKL